MDTYMASASSIERKWYVVDAEGQTLGRMAAGITHTPPALIRETM